MPLVARDPRSGLRPDRSLVPTLKLRGGSSHGKPAPSSGSGGKKNLHIEVTIPVEEDFIQGSFSEAGGVLVHLVLGTIYCWANFLSYAPESLLYWDGQSHPGKTPDAVQVMPFALIAQNFGLPVGSYMYKKFGPRVTSLFGCSLYVAGILIASVQTRLVPFILAYSLVAGLGVGCVYTAPMIAGWTWFPKSKGLVNGITLFGFGSGAFIFNKVSTSMAQSGVTWGPMLRRLAAIYAVLALTGALMIKEKRTVEERRNFLSKFFFKKEIKKEAAATLLQAVKSTRFQLLWLIGFNAFTPALTIMGLYKTYGMSDPRVADDVFLSFVGGMGAISSGCGRILWGRLIDKHGFQKSWMSTTVMQTMNMLLLPYATRSKTYFAAAICSTLLCLGGCNAMYITVNAQTFGVRNSGEIYSILFSAVSLASLFGARLAKALLGPYGWRGVFRVLACMCASNLGLLLWLQRVVSVSPPWSEMPGFPTAQSKAGKNLVAKVDARPPATNPAPNVQHGESPAPVPKVQNESRKSPVPTQEVKTTSGKSPSLESLKEKKKVARLA